MDELHPLTETDKFISVYLKNNSCNFKSERGILLHLNTILKTEFFSLTYVSLNMIKLHV